VILVEPKYSGNVGAIARSMMNFNVDRLILVNPCNLDDEAYARAVHATSILDSATVYDSFEKAATQVDFLVGTSAIFTNSEKKHIRIPTSLEDFVERIQQVDGTIGLVFGREDYGLLIEELSICDMLLTIPTSESYSSLNLSHAVSLVLYALFSAKESKNHLPVAPHRIDGNEKRMLLDSFASLLETIHYPDHKKDKTKVMFARMMGRALPSKWEYHTLMGVFQQAIKYNKKNRNNK
jgi:tRNA/rRNA methyltransferase